MRPLDANGVHAEPPTAVVRIGRPLGPLLFLAILVWPASGLTVDQRSTLAVTVWTATWWISAALPIAATSLLPAALFPFLGVLPGGEVGPMYMKDLVFLFLGAFVIALGLERWNVHKRIALAILALVGTRPRNLVFGFMLASALLSFWINNTSTTLLMLPIGLAVISSLRGDAQEKTSAFDPFAVSLLLGMAYSASVGGIATPVGTAPNQVFLGTFRDSYPEADAIGFADWMLAWTPLVLVYLPIGWLLLTRVAVRVPKESACAPDTIARARRALGKMGTGERRMAAMFALTALLWVTRADLELGAFRIPGWAGFVLPDRIASPDKFVTDATVATAMAVLLFVLPSGEPRGPLMDWKTAERLPWEVLLLLGGGFAIAGGFKATGLDEVLGREMAVLFQGQSEWVVVFVVVVFMAALTEVTSNTATTAVLVPVLGKAAAAAGLSPLLTMLPATVAASAAFMLPVATPPNAVVFSSRLVSSTQMARIGLWMNVALALIITLVFQLWVRPVFGIAAELPDWATNR